jgi:hypothetical protein
VPIGYFPTPLWPVSGLIRARVARTLVHTVGLRLSNRPHASLVIVLTWTFVAACSRTTDNGADQDPSNNPSRPHTDAGDNGVEGLVLSLQSTKLEPGQSTEVTVRVTPPGVYLVQLALLGGENDAYLDDPALSTNVNGVAKTRLTVVAHSGQELLLQAKAGSERATAKVDLNERSTADLAVVPLYSGNRPFDEWQVLWGPALSCELGYDDPAWNDAQIVSRALAPEGDVPEYTFAGVPSREPLSILVRAKSFAVGCVGGVNLTPQTINRVEIPINQRFADVSQLAFPIEMNIAPESEFWSNLLTTKNATPYIANLTSKFRGDALSDVGALLEAMGDLSSDPALFEETRYGADWETILTTNLSPEGAQSGLSSRVQRWLQDGAKLLQSPRAFLGSIQYHTDDRRGEFTLVSVAGKTPDECFLPESHLGSITVDAQDVLRVGFDLYFAPSALFTCLADAAVASGTDAGVSDVLSALSADFNCNLVSQWMTGPNGELFEGCDSACGQELCESALARLWDRVAVSDHTLTALEVNAAGRASLTDDALVLGVDASWVGTTSLDGVETSVGGTLRSCILDPDCQSMLPF